ncbi:MAG: hypothetical protein IJL93_00860, partial [Bacteroidales bacterium]|nr:hypothetical protein [Bacteroidales bacterium]
SVYGRIESGWKILDDGSVQYDFTVPANTTASLRLQADEDSEVEVVLGSAYAVAAEEGTAFCYELPSGRYRFIVR